MSVKILRGSRDRLTEKQINIMIEKAYLVEKRHERQIIIFQGIFISLLVTILLTIVDITSNLINEFYFRLFIIVILCIFSYFIYKENTKVSEKPILIATPNFYNEYIDKSKCLSEPIVLGWLIETKPSKRENNNSRK